jgi:uncharacterized protein (TIGR03083 family)
MLVLMTAEHVPQGDQVSVDLDPAAVVVAYARHRRRFGASVATLDERSLATQSRCSKWSVADVLRHGCDVDSWIQAVWTGKPLPFASFDPVVLPNEFVIAARSVPDLDVRDRYVVSSEMMAADVEGSDSTRWGLPAVTPIGFVPWWLSVLHVCYDSWLHERDVLLPLGVDVPVETEEALPVLAYTLALAGLVIAEPTDVVVAGVRLVVGSAPVRVSPSASGLDPAADVGHVIDALSGRGAVGDALADIDSEVAERLEGLTRFLTV